MNVRDRLQPALLDRLTDLAPLSSVEADDTRVMNKSQIRDAVLRDLSWLLNSVQSLGQLASRVDVGVLERTIKHAILRFEPRVMEDSLEVKALEATSVLDTHNVIEFEIRGFMWAQPVPLELLLRTQIDLEAGQVEVRDMGASAPRRRP